MNKVLIIFIVILTNGIPKNIQKKVNKQIIETFNVEHFSLTEFIIDPEIAKTLPSTFNQNNLYKVEAQDIFLGYAYVSKAFGKVDYFDYLVLMDKELIFLKTKILVYREDYGGEIGSKRWLKQFIGISKNDKLKYGENVAAISGATISVKVMTDALNNLLRSLKILHSKNIL